MSQIKLDKKTLSLYKVMRKRGFCKGQDALVQAIKVKQIKVLEQKHEQHQNPQA